MHSWFVNERLDLPSLKSIREIIYEEIHYLKPNHDQAPCHKQRKPEKYQNELKHIDISLRTAGCNEISMAI
jgi:hypothetical protein